MISVEVEKTSHSRGFLKARISSLTEGPLPCPPPVTDGTPAIVARAASTVSPEIAQNAARQPN